MDAERAKWDCHAASRFDINHALCKISKRLSEHYIFFQILYLLWVAIVFIVVACAIAARSYEPENEEYGLSR